MDYPDRDTLASRPPVDFLQPPALMLINASNLVWWLQALRETHPEAFESGSERRLKSFSKLP